MESRMERMLLGIVVATAGVVGVSCTGGEATDCALGREGCPCFGDICNDGLECNAGVCEAPPDATTSSGESDDESEDESESESESTSTSASTSGDESTSQSVDP